MNLTGTFVPAYSLNNLFSQIPVLGMILGGGQHEGLFAITFKVSGAASAPTLTVNPLSAIAPGFPAQAVRLPEAVTVKAAVDDPALSLLPAAADQAGRARTWRFLPSESLTTPWAVVFRARARLSRRLPRHR